MNEEILELANETTTNYSVVHHVFDRQQLEAFYKAAYNNGVSDSAKMCDTYEFDESWYVAKLIRALELK